MQGPGRFWSAPRRTTPTQNSHRCAHDHQTVGAISHRDRLEYRIRLRIHQGHRIGIAVGHHQAISGHRKGVRKRTHRNSGQNLFAGPVNHGDPTRCSKAHPFSHIGLGPHGVHDHSRRQFEARCGPDRLHGLGIHPFDAARIVQNDYSYIVLDKHALCNVTHGPLVYFSKHILFHSTSIPGNPR